MVIVYRQIRRCTFTLREAEDLSRRDVDDAFDALFGCRRQDVPGALYVRCDDLVRRPGLVVSDGTSVNDGLTPSGTPMHCGRVTEVVAVDEIEAGDTSTLGCQQLAQYSTDLSGGAGDQDSSHLRILAHLELSTDAAQGAIPTDGVRLRGATSLTLAPC